MKSIKQTEQLELYCYDIAGNLVKIDKEYLPTIYERIQEERHQDTIKYIATIKETLPEREFEGLISKCGIIKRTPSPCPCKSKECEEEYKKDIQSYNQLISSKAKGEMERVR